MRRPAEHEAAYRAAETAYWAHVGVARHEEWLDLPTTGTRVRVQVVGEGPPVVLLHGVNTSGAVWAPLVAELHGCRCLVVDRPGCGLSEPVPGRMDDVAGLAAFATRFTVELLDAMGIERAHLVSTSLGGNHALPCAAVHPERIAGVVQLGWPVGAPSGHLPLVMRLGGSRRLGRLMARMPAPKAAVRPMLARVGLRQAVEAGRVPDAMVDWFHALLTHTNTMRNELDGSPPIIRPLRGMAEEVLLPDDLLARIQVPVTFIWGDGDPFGSVAVAEGFAAKVPGARLVVRPDAGHAVWIDDVDGVATATTAALTGTEKTVGPTSPGPTASDQPRRWR